MKKDNNIQNCTHFVEPNRFGIVAMHCADNQPLSAADMKKIIDGPIAAVESDYQAEISKPLDLRKIKHSGS